MANPWFKMQHQILDNRKVQKLPDDLFKAWVNMLALACRYDGKLPPLEDVSFAFRLPLHDVTVLIERLLNAGLIDKHNGGPNGYHYKPHEWEEWQYKSTTSTERVRAHRKRSKNVSETHQSRAETEADTEQNTDLLARANDFDLAKLETDLREVAGWQQEPHPKLAVTGPIAELLATGHDWELDIAPVIRSRAPNVRRRTSWNYFIDAIKDAKLDREQARTPSPTNRTGAANAKPSSRNTGSAFAQASRLIDEGLDRRDGDTGHGDGGGPGHKAAAR